MKKTPHLSKIITVIALAAAVTGWFWFSKNDNKKGSTPALQFVEATIGNIEEVVTAQGKLEPKEYVDVGAQVSGQLKKIHVEIGDMVKKGDLLAEIDPRVYESRVQADKARLKTLNAQLSEQQAQIEFARQQYDRNERLIKSNAISQEALEDSETSLKVAQSRVASIKAQIEENRSTLEGDQTNLSYTKIYAPMDGTVVLQPTREGQTVNASQTAPIIVQLADLSLMTVKAQVAEADIMRLKTGMEVSFSTLGSLERRWKGTVQQILPSPEVINDVVLYNALVDVENKNKELMTGMSTQMFFELGKAENVLQIPATALGKRLKDQDTEAGHAYIVRVKDGQKTVERTVIIGLMSRSATEIKSGLQQGEQVAIPKQQNQGGQRPSGAGRAGGPRL